ncbi:MAG: hypothetical protein J6X26_03885 [Bacteroidales bacterium]|nr:hypothetical protein [Bacteroidales bacterium]
MRKVLFLTILCLSLIACKKEVEKTPEGPTDIRINNLTDLDFSGLSVTMADTTIVFGDISSKGISEYYRFKKAFPKAEINCVINGIHYSTGKVPDIYMQTLGQTKVTYHVYISDDLNNVLSISDVVIEEPLILE